MDQGGNLKAKVHRPAQPTPKELTDSCLDFLRRKFYNQPGDDRCFAQDRSRLLAWVVLWPAGWLNGKGVTLHGDRYRQIFYDVFFQADSHRSDKIKYRPAWMKMVIQSHFKIHGEDYYDEAKALRNKVDQVLLVAGRSLAPTTDPVRELAAARQILSSGKPKKTTVKPPVKAQLNLFS